MLKVLAMCGSRGEAGNGHKCKTFTPLDRLVFWNCPRLLWAAQQLKEKETFPWWYFQRSQHEIRSRRKILVFHVTGKTSSWNHLWWSAVPPTLLSLNLQPGTTYLELPKPGHPERFPWLFLSRSHQCRHWRAFQDLNKDCRWSWHMGAFCLPCQCLWSLPYYIFSDNLSYSPSLKGQHAKLGPQQIVNTASYHSPKSSYYSFLW